MNRVTIKPTHILLPITLLHIIIYYLPIYLLHIITLFTCLSQRGIRYHNSTGVALTVSDAVALYPHYVPESLPEFESASPPSIPEDTTAIFKRYNIYLKKVYKRYNIFKKGIIFFYFTFLSACLLIFN